MKKSLNRLQSYNNEQGAALVVVLMVFIVVTILGLAILGLAASNMTMATGDRNYQSAYYIAESGINARVNDISPQLKSAYAPATDITNFFNRIDAALNLGTNVVYTDFDSSFGQEPKANVKIEKLPSDSLVSYSKTYKITSTGTINNRSRTVSKVIHITWKPKSKVTIPASTVIFSKESYTVKNYKVTGSVGSNGNITLQGGQASISGSMNKYVNTSLALPDFPAFDPPANYSNFNDKTLTMDKDKAFNNLTVNNNSTLSIKMGTYNRNLVINKLSLGTNAKIVIDNNGGTGKLFIYTKSLSMSSGSIMNAGGDFEDVFIFLDSGQGTLLSGLINGSIYAKNSDIIINNLNGVGVTGHVITGGINVSILSNDTSASAPGKMLYAPLAKVYLNASFKGSIVANSIDSQGNDDQMVFQYTQIDYDNSPVYIDNGTGSSPVKDIITADPVKESD
ncbi:pilus assembly PilX N-terminal domain-containing protein [Neobacillus sp. Marseille-QA0830]